MDKLNSVDYHVIFNQCLLFVFQGTVCGGKVLNCMHVGETNRVGFCDDVMFIFHDKELAFKVFDGLVYGRVLKSPHLVFHFEYRLFGHHCWDANIYWDGSRKRAAVGANC